MHIHVDFQPQCDPREDIPPSPLKPKGIHIAGIYNATIIVQNKEREA